MATKTAASNFHDVFLLEGSNHTAKMVWGFSIGAIAMILAITLAMTTLHLDFLLLGVGFLFAGLLSTSWIGAGADVKGQTILRSIESNVKSKYGISVKLDENSVPENYWVDLGKTKEYTFLTPNGPASYEMYFLPNSEPVITSGI